MSNPLVTKLKDSQSKVAAQPNPFADGPMGSFFKAQTEKRETAQKATDDRRAQAGKAIGAIFLAPKPRPEPVVPESPSYEQLTAGQVQGPNVTASTEALPEQDEEGKRRRGGREQFAGGGAGIRVA